MDRTDAFAAAALRVTQNAIGIATTAIIHRPIVTGAVRWIARCNPAWIAAAPRIEVASPIPIVTLFVSAQVPVVAHNVMTRVFFANALYANTRTTIPVAWTTPVTGIVKARAIIIMRTGVGSTFVAIVAGARYAHTLF